MAPNNSMNLSYLLFVFLFLGMNSCEKDKDIFDEVIEEGIAESENENDSVDEIEDGAEGINEELEEGVEDAKDGLEDVLKAFPTAYGAGSNATGGRGRKVFFVTNLEDSGQGSFRQALIDVGNNGGGNILFRVSGTIELKQRTFFKIKNVTIAGQSAPKGGIDLTGKTLVFDQSENVIIRYLRFRPDFEDNDAVGFLDSDNIIIDHCSVSWGGDESVTFWGDSDDVSMQRLLIAEGKTGSILGDSDNPSISENLSLHNSLFYNISHRFPNPNSNERIDVINNVVFNWKYRLLTPTGNVKLNHISNYYSLGCLSSISGVENKIFEGDSPRIYTFGNYVDNGILTNENQDNWPLWRNFYAESQAPSSFKVKDRYSLLGNPVPIRSAEKAFENILEDVGANKTLDDNGVVVWDQDNLDGMYLSNVLSKNCVNYDSSGFNQSYTSTTHYQNYHALVSSSPRFFHSPNYDSDFDGMPDVWEIRVFGDLSKNGREDTDGNGYSDLEEYLNLVDGP